MSHAKIKLSSYQSMMLVFSSALGNIFIVLPKIIIDEIGRDAWITILISYGLGILFGFFILKIGSYFPNKTIVQYLPNILGLALGKIAGLFFLIIFLLLASWVFRENTERMLVFMPDTPPLVFTVMLSLICIYQLLAGFEVFARITEFLMPVMLFLILINFLMAFSISSFYELLPVFERGFIPIVKSVPITLTFALEPILFSGMWLPYVNKNKQLSKTILKGFIISSLIIILVAIIEVVILTPAIVASTLFPLLTISRLITITDFLPRVEVLFILLWIISSFVQIMVFLTSAVYGLSQWLHMKNHTLIIFTLTIVSVALSMLPKNIIEVNKLEYFTAIYGKLPMGFLILIMFILVQFRKLKT